MNVVPWLLDAGRPEAVALVTEDAEYRHGDLRSAVDQLAGYLQATGARRGEPVALVAENSFFSLVGYLGVMRAGCVAVPLASNVSPSTLEGILASTGVRRVIVQAKVLSDFEPVLGGAQQVIVDRKPDPGSGARTLFADVLEGTWPKLEERIGATGDELAVLMFTSGSTSQPRGVMLTHANLAANTRSILEYLPLTASDRVMAVLPSYYSFGASLVHTHLRAGGSIVFDRRFMFPDKVLRRMQETRCTGFAGVPSHFQILLRKSQLKKMLFPDLRWVQQAGGKLPGHFIEELVAALPQAKVYVMYGATEATARLCRLPPEDVLRKLGSVGKAIPGVEVELRDEEGKRVATGTVGEIVARGANISKGYFQAPAETEATFRAGWLHTGDLARQDDEGFLYIVDRAKDFIKVAGSRTSSKMLEEMLLQFPDIVEAAVLGVPDETLGEAVALFFVPRSPRDQTVTERLLAFAAEKLPAQLVPKVVKSVAGLPKNNSGKVQKPALRAQL